MITVTVMLAAIMTVLDSTIANVALPRIAGSMSASADQVTWVLTSYIVAAAIMTPMTGFLSGRFGAKRVFQVAIIGFTAASALCGAAQNLDQIVLFRVLQGAFGAVVMPLSQMVLIDTYPVEERGWAMSLWGMGVMFAPIIGPVLGGWLTDDFSWRWVFYINLPIGLACVLGVLAFIPRDRNTRKLPFDAVGFGLLAVTLAAFQLFLDRGQTNDWLQSPEVVVEASVAVVALILFGVHTLTAERPFVPRALLRDRNFVTATATNMMLGVLMYSVLALLPPMLETLFGYPVITAGMVTAPRGVGTLLSLFVVGRLVGRIDNRVLMMIGFGMFSLSYYGMSHFSLGMGAVGIALTGVIGGFGSGFIFTPMTVLAFATLDPALRGDGVGVSALMRNLGNSAGISIMQSLFTRNVQIVHARLVELMPPFSLTSPTGLAALNNEVTRQASMVAYVDVFHLLFWITIAVIPMALLLKSGNPTRREEGMVME
jgi:DHA2 family multidrug resistance protein